MNTDYMLIGVVLAGFVYLAGYQTAAFYAAGFFIILWIISKLTYKKPSAKKSNFLEPIVIESTRGAPYRIPDKMTLKFKDKASYDPPMYIEAASKGLIGQFGKLIGKGIGKMKGDE